MPLRLPSPDPRSNPSSPAATLLSPSWPQTRINRPRSGSQPYSQRGSMAFRDNLINNAERLRRRTMKVVNKMTMLQKILAVVALIILGVAGLLFLIFSDKIFNDILAPLAIKWKATTGGWVILWVMTLVVSFPPMIGFSTCGTLAGFVYGVGEGWVILSTATVVGSTLSLIVSRTVLRSYVDRLVANDKRFTALSLTIKHGGIKLLCMIRLAPLPYSISNGAMATFETVSPQTYALATTLITPKLFIHVFIGSRLADIANHGEEMSAAVRALNWISIAVFAAIGLVVGWYVYRKTMDKAAELEAQEAQKARESAGRTATPQRRFSDDVEAQVPADNTTHDNDDVDYFDDAPSPKPPYSDDMEAEEDLFSQGDKSYNDNTGFSGQNK